MPFLEYNDASIYYEEFGEGPPLLVFAPGGLSSNIALWRRPSAWLDPTTALAGEFRVIAYDFRNAGQSHAPIRPTDGWQQHADDQRALLDHLHVDRVELLGQCIGGPMCMGLIQADPARVAAAVLLQPSGRVGPIPAGTGYHSSFAQWAQALGDRPDANPEVIDAVYRHMYTQDFVYTVSRDFMRNCQTPLLVLAGNDEMHPFAVAEEAARLAPNAAFIPEWKEGAHKAEAQRRITEFLRRYAPQVAVQ